MAYNAKKTEHAGARKGGGAFYGPKVEAKKGSNRRRRENDKRAALNHGKSQDERQITCLNVQRIAGPAVFSASRGR